jgi:hypothetical protein
LWGANDVAKNESAKSLVHLSNFVKQRKITNVIMSAQKRHGLSTTSCVSSEVTMYNRELQKRVKMFEYAKILDSEIQIEHFTRHGLHVKKVRKELIAQRIMDHIKKTLLVRKHLP